jgi:hypothetical protein
MSENNRIQSIFFHIFEPSMKNTVGNLLILVVISYIPQN